jgi:hypothetical protein
MDITAIKQRACVGKQRYSDKARAKQVARKTGPKQGIRAKAYRCVFCPNYHVGHDLSRRAVDRLSLASLIPQHT